MRAALLSALLFLLAAPATLHNAAAQTTVSVDVTALPLDPENKARATVGGLAWRGGFAVTSRDDSFGGLSDLVLAGDGRSFTAITDQGRWLTAQLTYDAAGHLSGMTTASMGPLRDTSGQLLIGKTSQDAEALVRLADGHLLVAFERDHRLLRYPAAGLAGVPDAITAPPGLATAGINSGIEALLGLPGGRLLAFTEGQKAGEHYAVYLRAASGTWQTLALEPTGLFYPTGAALLPSGDILLLERRFTLLGGLGARLSRISRDSIRPGALLQGQEIAELRPPLTLDNFEGVAVHETGDGKVRITLISDDNFSPLQRTLIVQFELPEGG